MKHIFRVYSIFLIETYKFYSYVYEYFTCMYVCIPHVCLVLTKARGGCGEPNPAPLQDALPHYISSPAVINICLKLKIS